MGAEPGSVYGQQGTMKDILGRCLKKIDVQVRTLSGVNILPCNATFVLLLYTYLLGPDIIVSVPCASCVCTITGVY